MSSRCLLFIAIALGACGPPPAGEIDVCFDVAGDEPADGAPPEDRAVNDAVEGVFAAGGGTCAVGDGIAGLVVGDDGRAVSFSLAVREATGGAVAIAQPVDGARVVVQYTHEPNWSGAGPETFRLDVDGAPLAVAKTGGPEPSNVGGLIVRAGGWASLPALHTCGGFLTGRTLELTGEDGAVTSVGPGGIGVVVVGGARLEARTLSARSYDEVVVLCTDGAGSGTGGSWAVTRPP